jgi:hypothetical protein
MSACSDENYPDLVPPADTDTIEIGLSGSVGDGPVVSATITLQDAVGNVLLSGISDDQANYKLNGRVKRKDYPLVLAVDDGTDLVTGARPDFGMSAVIHQQGGNRIANLNPQGTLIRRIAQRLPGGLTVENSAIATATVLEQMSFGLDTAKVPDPVITQIDSANVTTIVRSSEALGEVLRRVRDRLIATGYNVTADDVFDVLAADLVDGVVDGRGDAEADARIAALLTLVSAQVIYETTQNRLKVDGYSATERLDNSIIQIAGNKQPAELTGDLLVTAGIIANAKQTFSALANYTDDIEAIVIRESLDRLTAGDTSSGAIAAYPAGAAAVFDAAITSVALAETSDLELVNATMRDGDITLPEAPEPDPETEPEPDVPGNTAPVISGSPAQAVMVENWYDFEPVVIDSENDPLVFSVVNRPAWLSFDAVTGRLSGFPSTSDAGRYVDIRLSVSDGELTSTLAPFTITVLEVPNAAPVISGSPATAIIAGQAYEFNANATDADGDELTFAISNMPAWSSFDTAEGRLYGTPSAADIGNSGAIVISVTDGKVSAELPSFSITVAAVPNTAPTISGSPATQLPVGEAYSFTPSAADADGDTLSFSIENRPAWASFNTATGRLYGTPDAGDAGTYGGIRIMVSDGVTSTSLGSFAIQVTAPVSSSGDVELTWVAPVTNVDGSALADLTGFKLYFGRVGDNLTESREIGNANATSYLVQDLDAGDWRFVLTAVNTGGQESRFSNEATFSIN